MKEKKIFLTKQSIQAYKEASDSFSFPLVIDEKSITSLDFNNYSIEEKIVIVKQYHNNKQIIEKLSYDPSFDVKMHCVLNKKCSLNFIFTNMSFQKFDSFLFSALALNPNFNNKHFNFIYNEFKRNSYKSDLNYNNPFQNFLLFTLLDFPHNHYDKTYVIESIKNKIKSFFTEDQIIENLTNPDNRIRNYCYFNFKRKNINNDLIKKQEFEYNLDKIQLPKKSYKKYYNDNRNYIKNLIHSNPFTPQGIIHKINKHYYNVNDTKTNKKSIKKHEDLIKNISNGRINQYLKSINENIKKNKIKFNSFLYKFNDIILRKDLNKTFDIIENIILNKNFTKEQALYLYDDLLSFHTENDIFNNGIILAFLNNPDKCPSKVYDFLIKNEHVITRQSLLGLIFQHKLIPEELIKLIFYKKLEEIKKTQDSIDEFYFFYYKKMVEFDNCPTDVLFNIIQNNELLNYLNEYYGPIQSDIDYEVNKFYSLIKSHKNYRNAAQYILKKITINQA